MGTKIFVGNLPFEATTEELIELFSQYGEVKKCDRLKLFAFVFMADANEAKVAVDCLNDYQLHNMKITVQLATNVHSRGDARGGNAGSRSNSGSLTTKIFIGNLPDCFPAQRLKALFEQYGRVVTGDVLEGQGFGFVHMSDVEEAARAIKGLNGQIVEGRKLTVEISTTTQKKGRGPESRRPERREFGSQRYDPYHHDFVPSRRLPAPPSLSNVSSILSDFNRASLQLQTASLFSPAIQLLAPPSVSSLGYSSSAALGLEAALRRSVVDDSRLSIASAQSSAQSNSGESFARELLKFYLKNPAGFDAYARDPLVRKALDLDDDREGISGVGGAHNMSQSQAGLPALSQSGGAEQQQHQLQQLYRGGLDSRY